MKPLKTSSCAIGEIAQIDQLVFQSSKGDAGTFRVTGDEQHAEHEKSKVNRGAIAVPKVVVEFVDHAAGNEVEQRGGEHDGKRNHHRLQSRPRHRRQLILHPHCLLISLAG